MSYLVVGADRVDAGKTTFSAGLLARTGGRGFKPRAGNDLWFDHDDCLRALESGRLYGKDAARLAAAEAGDRDPERLNPVHRLWRPAPGGGTGLLGRHDRAFLVDRVGPANDPTVVRNATVEIPETVATGLALDEAVPVETVGELDAVTERHYVPALERLAADVAAADVAVVESYGNVAHPLPSLESGTIDAVAAVEPRRVRIYRGDRYRRACDVASSSPVDGRIEKRVPDVLELLDPVDERALPALDGETRTDPKAVADAYGDAYDALLAVA